MANRYTTEPAKISIAICTRERPIMLSNLLESFEQIEPLEGVEVVLDIIENHTEANQQKLITDLAPSLPFPINHHWEPNIGIPIARNHALRVATQSGATHIIFIDDDERVDPNWLKELWSAYLSYDENTVIQGAVISCINTTKNKHLHGFFQRKIEHSGKHLDVCATNNVIIPLHTLYTHNLQFDETYPLAGGTDSKLFRKAYQEGILMVFCAEAIVYEDIPDERVNITWLSKRNYRIGLTVGQHGKKTGSGLIFLLEQIWKMIRYFLKLLTYVLRLNRRKFDKKILRCAQIIGRILGFLGMRVNSYKKVDGH